jgi:hypothetical protein
MWMDLDFADQVIEVKRAYVWAQFKVPKSKASKAPVPMHPVLAGFLMAWRERTPYAKDDDFVFPSFRLKMCESLQLRLDKRDAPTFPYLGQRMLPSRFLRTPIVLRELLPQDLKLEMDQLTRDQAIGVARFLAAVLGEAHAKQMDTAKRTQWRVELGRNRSKNLDVPSWLWKTVVQLVADHEMAYLEHCRQYALEATMVNR